MPAAPATELIRAGVPALRCGLTIGAGAWMLGRRACAAQGVLAEARASGVVTILPEPLAWPKLIAHLADMPHGPCQ